ncbi:MAG: aspartate--tRNA ligase, partial [Candidatus Neomarinimicrobiota bacterium]
MLKRTHTCGELRKLQIGETVTVMGWVNTIRLHGQVIFMDLRDRYGKTQLVFNMENYSADFDQVKKLSIEDVLCVDGIVTGRDSRAVNPEMETGEIEISVNNLIVLNETAPLPFTVQDRHSAEEDLRLKYRYLELRTEELQKNLLLRHLTYQSVRKYLSGRKFLEIETPVMMKSTPEGARDYLIPSRIQRGKFYALPQSPQTYKQLLMIGGCDRYFQIVKCFRDEDLRADRQPEFTQIDMEMSFADEEDVWNVSEGLTRAVFKEIIGVNLPAEFPRMTHKEALTRFGSDKPDLRFGLELQDVKSFTDLSDFKHFKSVQTVNALIVSEGAEYSRKIIEELTVFAKKYGAGGLAWIKVDEEFKGGISKFFKHELQIEMRTGLKLKYGDLLLVIGDKESVVQTALGALRLEIARKENLIDQKLYKPLWVIDFPMFDWDDKNKRFTAVHHPFTAPKTENIEELEKSAGTILSRGYDLVINGFEIAGGSIRIHKQEVQQKVFDLLKISPAEAKLKFGFLLDALKFGAPPHGGIAFGFDRLMMILAGTDNIRDVIAFPKTTSAASLMDDSPSFVSEEQLQELG